MKQPFAKLRSLLEASTPGPWEQDYAQRLFSKVGKGTQFFVANCREPTAYRDSEVCEANATFMAEAHNQLPALLEALDTQAEQLRLAVEVLEESAKDYCSPHAFSAEAALVKIKALSHK